MSIPHGTPSAYTYHKCRCDDCRNAINAYTRERRRIKNEANGTGRRKGSDHGTFSHYVNAKCRCEPCKIAAKTYRIARAYGITYEQLVAMRVEQWDRCASCRDYMTPNTSEEHIDHDHATGKVRGLLCTRCNIALGMLLDDPARIIALHLYLMRSRIE